ncbi:hypothetical protein ASE75_00740 [Sphingomonas sp. Leaf17]|uniref:hypothetical protein n=1 Tax=Sphingomonas sp. Leaf17 TaxID=1735683 RepID=UPI0006FD2069|nr:hypothetical protein [Sphingomonas sp. Leaf17]KQM67514.1 hypothetical protein ASE75_00740 [Sphingomonas sp. Leaf17]
MRIARPFLTGLLLWLALAMPANAAVTITFWSHELGNSFPHAFFSLRGTPDAGGPPVDANYGFTPKAITPAMLFGTIPGRLDIAKPGYIRGSDAQFAMTITDAQYAAVLGLVRQFGDPVTRYDLKTRNCVHFTKEAARLLGLDGIDQPKLMKKPRSYLKAVGRANIGRVTILGIHGKTYLAGLSPLGAAADTNPARVRLPAGSAPATAAAD